MISCDRCGEKFQTPVLARLYGNAQTYYACPHCLTKIRKATEKMEKTEKTLPSKKRAKSVRVGAYTWQPGPKVKYQNPDAWISYLKS